MNIRRLLRSASCAFVVSGCDAFWDGTKSLFPHYSFGGTARNGRGTKPPNRAFTIDFGSFRHDERLSCSRVAHIASEDQQCTDLWNGRFRTLSNEEHLIKSGQDLLRRIDGILFSAGAYVNFSNVLRRIDSEHAQDCMLYSSLASENVQSHDDNIEPLELEWITPLGVSALPELAPSNVVPHSDVVQSYKPIAARTIGPAPLINRTAISQIISAAEALWEKNKGESNVPTSRFTYQRKGNYEAHLIDLAIADPQVKAVIDEVLTLKVYPLARAVLAKLHGDCEGMSLCMYDSLVIRYNATEAAIGNGADPSFVGAGQPLHRDGSIISVNIMLNSAEHFEGGGTLFENQLLSCMDGDGQARPEPLKPIGTGHAIAHLSHERHAGAGTVWGVRDILVLFVTAKTRDERRMGGSDTCARASGSNAINGRDDVVVPSPRLERAARLKGTSRSYCQGGGKGGEKDSILCRALHNRLALDSVPTDGEAWHYLGMALQDYHSILVSAIGHSTDPKSSEQTTLELALDCMEHATSLTPCDARLYNNLGLALERIAKYKQPSNDAEWARNTRKCVWSYQRAIRLNALSELAGCDVASDYDSATLNLGLHLANSDRFTEAAEVLSRMKKHRHQDDASSSHRRVISDALSLLQFCERRAYCE